MSLDDYQTPPDENFKTFNETVNKSVIVSSVITVLIAVIIAAVLIYVCKNRKRIGKDIVDDVREITAAPPPRVQANSVPICEGDAPTMERFFQELAEEKPVRFTAQQLCSFTNNYAKILGSGGYGKVYEGKFPNGTGVKVAVKVLNRGANNASFIEQQFMAEVGSIGRTHHINLVRLYGFCYDQFMSALVYEFMENGSLDKHLFNENRLLEWEKLHEIAVGTAKGIAYLHEECEKRIIHYDIKPENVLLDASFSPKVADFGLAKLCSREETHVSLTGYRGTPGYSAPEFMLRNHPITYKCDVYSFGMLLFEIVGRRRNANTGSGGGGDSIDWFPEQVWEKYEKRELVALVEGYGIEKIDEKSKAERMCIVALWCVQDSPESRPRMSAVVKMLEGGVEIVPPPKPFNYWFANALRGNSVSSQSSTTTSDGSDSYWYKKPATATAATTTPIMKKYEINVVTM
ncbi:hypothetical protein C2S53_008376 [Perilla frutescens var. hirtella]|uniref:Protein kinase domain-containing protein n=1 Tax=Perilla frutescens var. hirtella TaxID=608512 RepID=A0AAD4JDK0_PERFH|nr:hypothetical protein C2S53_008376 [Perilla frutescens var. hirtella]